MFLGVNVTVSPSLSPYSKRFYQSTLDTIRTSELTIDNYFIYNFLQSDNTQKYDRTLATLP